MRIRIVKTSPGQHTVQVVSKRHGKLIIHKHLGTFKNEFDLPFGFNKDGHFQDTQAVVELVVNQQGFPLYFDVFPGNTDAAIISKDNMDKLIEKNIGFIVGARLSGLSAKLQEEICQKLNQENEK